MITNSKPRISVRADASPVAVVEAIMKKAASDVADVVDIQPRYDENFQAGLMQQPPSSELGVPLPASGNGTAIMAREYSELPGQVQALAELYSTFAEKLDGRLGKMEKAIGLLLAAKAGLSKAPDWQSKQTAKEDDDDDDKPDDGEVEKAVTAVKSGKATVQQVMTFLQHGQRDPVKHAPDMTAFAKAHAGDAPSDEEIGAMNCEDATEALLERQRNSHRARIAAGSLVLQPVRW